MRVEEAGDLGKGQLAEADEVSLGKKLAIARWTRSSGIDFAGLEALEQVLGGEVEVHNLVCAGHDFIRDAFLYADAGVLLDDVIERLEVLDIDRADDIDAGGEQVLDILVAFPVLDAGGVGVGEFVHEGDGGLAGEDGVEVHLGELDAVVLADARRDDFEVP